MVVEFGEDGFAIGVAVVAPFDEAVAVSAEGVAHEVVFEEVAVPF